MNENKNIFVFPCGSEIGLEIHKSLQYSKGISLYGGSSIDDHGRMVYKNYISGIPDVCNEKFIYEINKLIDKYNIDYIIPAHDSVVLQLALNQKLLNAIVLTSDKDTCSLCRSKHKTYNYFENYNITPNVYENVEDIDKYPVFLKPDVGQGSKGVVLANSRDEVIYNLKQNNDLLILEYLPGKEFTIDCFTDKYRKLKFIGQRSRHRVKSGISVNSVSEMFSKEVECIANIINNNLNLRGGWFFQVKEDIDGNLKLLEIAPRIAGTMNLYRNKGVNIPLLSIFDREGYDIEIIENEFELEVDRALINRFNLKFEYECVFLDFDDTLTHNENINLFVVMFLYQCVTRNKTVYLITKHRNDINETLEKLKIHKGLFEEIIHIKKNEDKSFYIKKVYNYKKSIFIDDSFKERLNISKTLNIPVFDIDSIESLIDWKN